VTYLVQSNEKHWSNMYVLGMSFIDLFIGSFVLPLRFVNAFVNPLSPKLCTALYIGEVCAMGSVIYAITFMIYTRLYALKSPSSNIHCRYPIILLITSWIILFLFYGIPFMTNYFTLITSTGLNVTDYCKTYSSSISHPPWMSYTEIGMIYFCPFLCIAIGLRFLIHHLYQPKPLRLDINQRKCYLERKQLTRHVVILTLTFILLWLPWIIIRIIFIFYNPTQIRNALQITYYILLLKCALFPILYASTNSSFRCSFAIYRHTRITTNNRIWTINEPCRS
jgi:hypothetical protein